MPDKTWEKDQPERKTRDGDAKKDEEKQHNKEKQDSEKRMTEAIHPARQITFEELWDGLQKAKTKGLVTESFSQGLHLFCYSNACVYDNGWDAITLLARGLILDPKSKRLAATPFPKFFNLGEKIDAIPDLPFETYEKLDGSLIILFYHNHWRTATKGSLVSDQSKWAARWLAHYDLSCLDKETTYLAEAIYPENRIVVHYQYSGLVLLAAYQGDGVEVNYADLLRLGNQLGWKVSKRYAFTTVSQLLALVKTLSANEEGFVLRFANGLRLKIKGDEYCRIHRLVSRVTPLAIWEALQAGNDLDELRRQLPEEFRADFDNIVAILQGQITNLLNAVKQQAHQVAHLSDKEVGLRLNTFPAEVRSFIFPYRKGDLLSGRSRILVFRVIRPTGNRLTGYTPSTAINRVMDETV